MKWRFSEMQVNWDEYDTVIIASPLWWSNMAATMQTFLFHNGTSLAGKNIGLIVSSASSGILGVEAASRHKWRQSDACRRCRSWLVSGGRKTCAGDIARHGNPYPRQRETLARGCRRQLGSHISLSRYRAITSPTNGLSL